jgi:hypothetical protein
MTELEMNLYEECMKQIPDILSRIEKNKYTRLMSFPIFIDGCMDSLLFDTDKKEPLYLEYRYGLGEAIEGLGSSAFFDDFELRKIEIKMTITDLFVKIASEQGATIEQKDIDFLKRLEESDKEVNYQRGFNEALQLAINAK